MKIVVLDGYAMNPGDLSWEELKAMGDCTIYERTMPGKVMERARGAEVLLTNKTFLRAEHIEALPDLKYVGVLATGYNVVDIEAAKKRGIIVTNIPAYSTKSVAQMVFAHILNITNRVEHYAEEVQKGEWTRSRDFSYWNTPLVELDGLKIGIVGLGHTGQAVAHIARSFGMEVYAFTSKPENKLPEGVQSKTLDEIFAKCDIVSLHCPLTPETRNMVNVERLAIMKPTAILINTGRGPLVDEHALADALNNKVIAAAGVDVLSSEPPKADNPLLKARNCFITPHIAWATHAARKRLMAITVDNLKGYISGKVINNVAK